MMEKAFLFGSRGADFFLAAGFFLGAAFFFADFFGMSETWLHEPNRTSGNSFAAKLYHYRVESRVDRGRGDGLFSTSFSNEHA